MKHKATGFAVKHKLLKEELVKRIGLILFLVILMTGVIFAQDRGDRPDRGNHHERFNRQDGTRQFQRENVTINGKLQMERGVFAVASGDSVYFVPVLGRYVGFIDGLKEGANVSIEGYLFRNIIHPVKITIDGKSHDFPAFNREFSGERFNERFGENLRERFGENFRERFGDGNFRPGRGGNPGHNRDGQKPGWERPNRQSQ